ncbi:hypothetical protein LWI29_025967 [Acer saccharum]|uniref:MATH domain-containing protein n=1 Tax=Acer saccharum TaxID=4024 RepID=A0AA39S0F8_ACESA|nr:hypothetical protein LWI29_025967 [Acer saccharum]
MLKVEARKHIRVEELIWSLEIMAKNEHQSRERSIDIDRDNNLEEILEAGPDCCIYRVPQYLRKINEEAYTPYFISIGPLHYGRKELIGMERQKRRYWSEFGKRLNNAQKLEEFKTYIKNQEQTIRAHYSVTSTISSSKYVEIILRDAIFIIELFMRNDGGHKDFLLNNAQHIVSISQDLLLLENQIPYFILNHLYSSVFPSSGHPSFFALCLNFFENTGMFNWSFSEQPQLKHFTDFLRCAAVGQVQRTVQSGGGIPGLPCATKLKKSGLEFKDAKGAVKRFDKLTTVWGFDQLLSLEKFNDSSNGYLVNDCCAFGAEVFIVQPNSGKEEILSMVKKPPGGIFTWPVQNFRMLNESLQSSIEFTVGDRKWLHLF